MTFKLHFIPLNSRWKITSLPGPQLVHIDQRRCPDSFKKCHTTQRNSAIYVRGKGPCGADSALQGLLRNPASQQGGIYWRFAQEEVPRIGVEIASWQMSCARLHGSIQRFQPPPQLSNLVALNTQKFTALGNAYAVLSDEKKREDYDRYGSEDQRTQRRRHHHRTSDFYEYDVNRGFEGWGTNVYYTK